MSNQLSGIGVNRFTEEKRFDRLPPPVREVIARAAFHYALAGIEKHYRAHIASGGTVQEFRKLLIATFCEDLMRAARKTYGPDHPDATISRLRGTAIEGGSRDSAA